MDLLRKEDKSIVELTCKLSHNPVLSALIETEPGLAVFLAEDYTIRELNQLAADSFCLPDKALVGTNFIELFNQQNWKCPISPGSISTPRASRVKVVTQLNRSEVDWTIISILANGKVYGYLITGLIRTTPKSSADSRHFFIADHLETILDSVPCAIFWKDICLEYLGCNRNYASLIGVENKQQVIGKKDRALGWCTHDSSSALEQLEFKVLQTKRPQTNAKENHALCDGGNAILYASRIPLFDDENNVVGLLGIYVDAMQVEQDKSQIERLLVELQTIIDNVPNAIFWKDTESRFLGCNAQFAKFAGMSPQDIIGKTDYELPWSNEESDSYRIDDLQVMQSRQAKLDIEEPQTIQRDKKLVLSTSKVPLIDKNDNVIGVLCVYKDITERKEAERIATKLLLEKEKSTLFRLLSSSIAHELRTPLSSIYFANDAVKKVFPVLLDTYHSAVKAELPLEIIPSRRLTSFSQVVSRIESEIRHCNIFIDMTLAKLKYERIVLNELVPISMAVAVKEAVELYPFKENQKKIVCLQFSENEDFIFHAEPMSFQHVLFNLLKNALYFIEAARKGEITIWFDKDEKNNYLFFKDTGKGISQEQAQQVFNEFYTCSEEGTGLGLTYCKAVMQSIQGNITCDGRAGSYIQFTLTFPAKKINL